MVQFCKPPAVGPKLAKIGQTEVQILPLTAGSHFTYVISLALFSLLSFLLALLLLVFAFLPFLSLLAFLFLAVLESTS